MVFKNRMKWNLYAFSFYAEIYKGKASILLGKDF